jgi:hypothetical protein
VPAEVIDTVRALSSTQPDTRFLLLCTACAVQCWDCGHIIERGDVIASFEGEGALSRLVRFFGVDLDAREYFAPLTRDFPWTKLQP